MAKTQKTHLGWNVRPNRRQRFVAARGGDAIGLGEQRGFQVRMAAFPFGDFQARAQFRFGVIERMRKHARNERGA